MRAGIAVAALLALSACENRNSIKLGTASAVTPVADLPAPDPRDLAGATQPAYYIGPQDKLEVTVVNLPEATRTVVVDPSGAINLPYVGVVPAGGRTTGEVAGTIRARLAAAVLQRPDVTVAISDTMSQRVTIEGAVGQPGSYPLPGPTTLLRAVTLARGTTNVANEKVVAVFRTIKGQPMAAVFNLDMIRRGDLADPAVYGNDVVVVERSRGKVLLRDVISTFPIIGAFYQIDRIAR